MLEEFTPRGATKVRKMTAHTITALLVDFVQENFRRFRGAGKVFWERV